jgi:hypothetical protein
MGIHFACHHCNYALHVKDFQGGKRGRCPECKGPFRIPLEDASHSSEVVDAEAELMSSSAKAGGKASVMEPSMELEHSTGVEQALGLKSSRPAKGELSNRQSSQVNKAKSEMAPLPAVLANSLGAKWFVRPPTGGQFGPASSQLLMDWIQERRVTSDSLLWKEGTPNWQLASDLLPELYAATKSAILETSPLFGPSVVDLEEEAKRGVSKGTSKRQSKKRRQQLTMVIILGLVSLLLFVALIVVLVIQANK